ncbi:hypothetical protein P6F28_06945 [Roseicyclus marinus]|uniref:hypothetical protein n=1 Tax=Roseicyclus marinus TaxID=2161673 RepID=UPI00240FC1A3|nr:hypothetical protein [Roseicyclus marinus]MDG3041011.1 hypothetical protein [Roseicyclus marinus]
MDRSEALFAKRREVYAAYLLALHGFVTRRDQVSRDRLDLANIEAVIFASDGILQRLFSIQEGLMMGSDFAYSSRSELVSLVAEMRRECFEATEFDEQKLLYLLAIGRDTPLEGTPEAHFEPE